MARSKKEVESIVSGMGVFTAIISNLVELIKKFGGTMEQLYQLATPEGTETLEKVAKLIAGCATEVKTRYTRLISGGEKLIIDAASGDEMLMDAKELFQAGIDSDFVNWGADEKGSATPETAVEIREMIENATYAQMFGELSGDVNNLCFTHHQIKNFVKKHRNWLRQDGYATFFLFKSKGHCFVASVHFYSDGSLCVNVSRFGYDDRWNAGNRHRLVVPRLAETL